jgi:hypothetical protein
VAIAPRTFVSSTNVTTNLTAAYTGAAGDLGLLALITQTLVATDEITTVDVGGTNLTEVTGSPISIGAGDIMAVYAYYLPSGAPTSGAQTVTATVSGASTKRMGVYVLSGTTAIDIVSTATNASSVANPRGMLGTDGRALFAALVGGMGGGAVGDYNPLAYWDGATNGFEQDQGVNGSAVYGYTIIDNLPVLVGWDGAADEALMFAVSASDRSPIIDSVPYVAYSGQSLTIGGRFFEAAQGSGSVVISPTDNVADGNAVTQSINSWADTSITITVVRGTLVYNTPQYLFVTGDAGGSSFRGVPIVFPRNGSVRRHGRYPI